MWASSWVESAHACEGHETGCTASPVAKPCRRTRPASGSSPVRLSAGREDQSWRSRAAVHGRVIVHSPGG
jgi:hypothetical protein